ncbi:MAG: 7TM diverse intracellular signaling domain-containing protein [Anaerotignum sp.]|nr:7TM diverse intracellular signaling domain-containing protein [Anaerotignum sp.]
MILLKLYETWSKNGVVILAKRFDHKKVLILICIIMVITILPFYAWGESNAPKPTNGVLDLSNWDLNQERVDLTGDWEFYWDKLYTYDDFEAVAEGEKQYEYVPKVWNSYEHNGKNLPGFGYATYRLKVIANDVKQPLSLRLDTMSTAYRLFVNDTEIASNGEVGTDKETSKPYYQPTAVNFQPPAKEFYLIIQVSNFTYARGGIWYVISMGTPEKIEALNRIIMYKDAILIGSLLIMLLYYSANFFVLNKDKRSGYFALICILFILRTLLNGDLLMVRLFPNIPFGFLVFFSYLTLFWIPAIFFLLIDSIFKIKAPFNVRKALVIYGIAGTLLAAILPIYIYTVFITGVEIVIVVTAVFLIGIVTKAYIKKQRNAGVILGAVLLLLATGVHDFLYQADVIHHSLGEMSSIGIFLFMFAFSFVIASLILDALEQSKRLSLQLADSLEKEKIAANELVKTELAFLKAQIKPHFIYNSISVIAALTMDDPKKAKGLLYDLSDYLRGSFRFENYEGMTPLSDELETTKAYISIEKARFYDKLTVEYDIDESISVFIPLLTIQPIVENAVRHGIFNKPEGGKVSLRIYRDENFVTIEVTDDGIGMPAEVVQEIFKEGASGKGVGLKNINRRLKLFYGEGLKVRCEEGKGTMVSFRIPQEGEME